MYIFLKVFLHLWFLLRRGLFILAFLFICWHNVCHFYSFSQDWLLKEYATLYRNQHSLPYFCASGTIEMSLSLPYIFKLTFLDHNNKSSQRGTSGKTSYFLGSYFPLFVGCPSHLSKNILGSRGASTKKPTVVDSHKIRDRHKGTGQHTGKKSVTAWE